MQAIFIHNTIKNLVSEQTQKHDQLNSGQNIIKIVEVDLETESQKQLNIQEPEKLVDLKSGFIYSFKQLQCCKNLNKYYKAIECYDKALSINPNKDSAWCNKGNQQFSINVKKQQNAMTKLFPLIQIKKLLGVVKASHQFQLQKFVITYVKEIQGYHHLLLLISIHEHYFSKIKTKS
ncbi:unnamed protein product [Paramecium octaurelia]|uniref:Tetratricopeptide repeat protein n=1 Tax=Paramecium octaurelia TaxID=43137 RepID=A0A8S1XR38_PAROT|nr:unnamed protein product [Paramecium octaurelia]